MQRETIDICLEMLRSVSIPLSLPDAAERMERLVAARTDLETELAKLPAVEETP